jgi:hypothetical protein
MSLDAETCPIALGAAIETERWQQLATAQAPCGISSRRSRAKTTSIRARLQKNLHL